MSTDLQKYQEQILAKTSYIYRTYRSKLNLPSTDSELENHEFPSEGPITSIEGVRLLDRLLQNKTYLLIRTQNTMYTLGLWLLFGLPELVIDVTDLPNSSQSDVDDLDKIDAQIESGLTDTQFQNYVRPIVDAYVSRSSLPTIDKKNAKFNLVRRYDQEDMTLTFDGSDFTLNVNLRRVPEDEYLTLNSTFMIWFYTYYVLADNDRPIVVSEEDSKVIDEHDGLEYQLYPIYHATISFSDLSKLTTSKGVTENELENLIDRYIDYDLNDFSSDSLDDVETDDTLSE